MWNRPWGIREAAKQPPGTMSPFGWGLFVLSHLVLICWRLLNPRRVRLLRCFREVFELADGHWLRRQGHETNRGRAVTVSLI